MVKGSEAGSALHDDSRSRLVAPRFHQRIDVVQRTMQARCRFGLARPWLQSVHYRTSAITDDFLAHAQAMRREHGRQRVSARAQVGQHIAVGDLGDALAIGETEGIAEEQLTVLRVRLEDQLVDVGELLLVLRQPDLHARLQQRAEGLRKHGG